MTKMPPNHALQRTPEALGRERVNEVGSVIIA
jgi:hypothetical protein